MAREYLKKAREAKGITLQDAAKALGMSAEAYDYFEQEKFEKDMPLSLALKVCKTFDLSIDYVIAEESK